MMTGLPRARLPEAILLTGTDYQPSAIGTERHIRRKTRCQFSLPGAGSPIPNLHIPIVPSPRRHPARVGAYADELHCRLGSGHGPQLLGLDVKDKAALSKDHAQCGSIKGNATACRRVIRAEA